MHDETNSAGASKSARPAAPRDVSPPDAPNVALRQAVTGVLTFCRQLAQAIDDHDFEAVEGAAAKAVNLWLSARRACRRLVTDSDHPSPLMYVAIETIEDTYRRLVVLFRRAIQELGVPRTSRALAALRTEMDVARGEPLLVPRSNTAARRSQRDTQEMKPVKPVKP